MSTESLRVGDIMTKKVVAVDADENLLSAVQLFEQYGFGGFPVIDGGKLVGVLTEYDLISCNSGVHIPTIVGIFNKITFNRKDKGELKSYLKALRNIKVRDVMNSDPLTVGEREPVENLVKEFYEHHKVNPVIVVDGGGNLAGVVSRHDLLRFFNENYLHASLGEENRAKAELIGLGKRTTGRLADRFIASVSHKFVVVSKRRQFMWELIAIISFIMGFLAAMIWMLRIASK